MARDYKHAAPPPRGSASRVSTGGLGLIVGFAVGFGTAVLLQVGVPGKETSTSQSNQGNASTQADPETGKETPANDTDASGNRTTFDFYKMLPKFEVVIPEQDKDVRRSGEVSTIEKPGAYVLQVGSFQTEKDADRLRGELALLGIEADIQTVTIDSDQTWHRVRIGPIESLEKLNELRQRLAENEMQALVIKVGE